MSQSLPTTSTQFGKALRQKVPRSAQSEWKPRQRGRDVIAILKATDKGRIRSLIPLRYERMIQSPFAFLRGSAAVMAFDLGHVVGSGLRVQACGDCHLLNFGAFATPERNLIFDINDFDETLPAPWEWDIKRLAASIMVAGRYRHFPDRLCKAAVVAAVSSYRKRLAEYARCSRLEVWYARIDAADVVAVASKVNATGGGAAAHDITSANLSARLLPKLTEIIDGHRRIKDDPPLVFHPMRGRTFFNLFRNAISRYRSSLPPERRLLANRYEVVDVAMKVVGVGSVGTVCAVALLQADDDDYLFLQVKQARQSVLEPYAGKSVYCNQAERVVVGQRMTQSASDVFLGWSTIAKPPLDLYFRQLRDVKVAIDISTLDCSAFSEYASFCGWAVARAHAKTGDAAAITGYLGSADVFDKALTRFATSYADQTEQDHATLLKAVKVGRLGR